MIIEDKDLGRFISESEIEYLRCVYNYKIGKNVKIARNVVIDCKELEIGENTIISDFVILTGKIKIGKHSHVAHRVHLSGTHGINAGNHFTISSGSIVYTESDDHKGKALIGPQIPSSLRSTYAAPVTFDDYVAVSVQCIIMPGSHMMDGSMLRLRSNLFGSICKPWCEYGSHSPFSNAQFIRKRSDEQKLLSRHEEEWYS